MRNVSDDDAKAHEDLGNDLLETEPLEELDEAFATAA